MMLAALLWWMTQSLSTCEPYLLPDAISSAVRKTPGWSAVFNLNPAYLRGDFDGDGCLDYVVLAKSAGAELALLVCWGNGTAETISTTQIVGFPATWRFDFDGWMVVDSQTLGDSRPEDMKPPPMGDLIMLTWVEDGGGFVYRADGTWHLYGGGC